MVKPKYQYSVTDYVDLVKSFLTFRKLLTIALSMPEQYFTQLTEI